MDLTAYATLPTPLRDAAPALAREPPPALRLSISSTSSARAAFDVLATFAACLFFALLSAKASFAPFVGWAPGTESPFRGFTTIVSLCACCKCQNILVDSAEAMAAEDNRVSCLIVATVLRSLVPPRRAQHL